jgi:hypothetical protein
MIECLSCIPLSIAKEMNSALFKPCTPDEVSLALLSMDPFKSAGPDGFPAYFYQ